MARKSPGRHRQNPAYLRHLMGACDRGTCAYCLGLDVGLTAVAARGSVSPLAILAEILRGQLAAAIPVSAALIDALDELVPGWRAGCSAPMVATAAELGAVELPAPRTGPLRLVADDGAYSDTWYDDQAPGIEWQRELAAEGLRPPVASGGFASFAERYDHLARQALGSDVPSEDDQAQEGNQ